MVGGHRPTASSLAKPARAEFPLAETGCHVVASRDRWAVPANCPLTGAGNIAGSLGVSNVGSHVLLLLRLGLEVDARVDPHIGGVNNNEGMGNMS